MSTVNDREDVDYTSVKKLGHVRKFQITYLWRTWQVHRQVLHIFQGERAHVSSVFVGLVAD